MYFKELQRVSQNQIIWGGNYFADLFRASSCWLVWNKKTVGNTADCELAWSSFNTAVRRFDYMWEGFWQENMKDKEKRIHPTQKPVALYKWLLKNYAKEGDKIFDSHLGSGSIAIACHDYKFSLVGTELDKDYYEAACKRFKQHTSQLSFV
jgi:site-specific DNA-methyltransferase (adenine-specific)